MIDCLHQTLPIDSLKHVNWSSLESFEVVPGGHTSFHMTFVAWDAIVWGVRGWTNIRAYCQPLKRHPKWKTRRDWAKDGTCEASWLLQWLEQICELPWWRAAFLGPCLLLTCGLSALYGPSCFLCRRLWPLLCLGMRESCVEFRIQTLGQIQGRLNL